MRALCVYLGLWHLDGRDEDKIGELLSICILCSARMTVKCCGKTYRRTAEEK